MSAATERRLAQAARSLAGHLIRYAKERDDGSKRLIATINKEICDLYRQERGEEETTNGQGTS